MATDAGVIVETAGGLIVNRIVWSAEVPSLDFGAGLVAVQEPADASYAIGGTLVGGVYTAPPAQPLPPPPPPYVDANARLDAGINASIAAAEAVRNSIHAVPATFTAANFQAFLIQAKILSDAFLAMLEAQQTAPPP